MRKNFVNSMFDKFSKMTENILLLTKEKICTHIRLISYSDWLICARLYHHIMKLKFKFQYPR